MDYKVDFVTQTERDLFSITQFLAEKNPAAAQHLGDAPIDAALSLGSLPRRGGLVIGRPGVLKLVHLPYHVILYRIDETKRLVESCAFGTAVKTQPSSNFHSDDLVQLLDAALCRNPAYSYGRKLGQLNVPRVVKVRTGAYHSCIATEVRRRRVAGEIKPVALSTRRNWAAEFSVY